MTKKQQPVKYVIDITLTEGRTCRFEYSDPMLAKEQDLYYRTVGVISNQIIKSIQLSEVNTKD